MFQYDRKTGRYESSREFWTSARKFFSGDRQDQRILDLQKAANVEGIDSSGGVLVPEMNQNEVLSVALEGAIVRPRALVFPMETDILNIPRLVDTDRSSNIFGGVTFTWQGEGAELFTGASQPALGNIKLNHHKLTGTAIASREVEDDIMGFGTFMNQAFGRALRFLEDDAYIWGNGVGQPQGIMNSGAMIAVTRQGNGYVDMPDIGNMAARLLPDSWSRAVWIISQSVLAQWMTLNDAGANVASFIDLSTMQCLGCPILVSEHAAALGTSGDIILADFAHFILGGQDMVVSSSREANCSSGTAGWTRDQTLWKLVMHVDGQPMLGAPITPKRGGATISPFVALTTAS